MSEVLPLAGMRVLVMRAVHQAGTLSERLREMGAEPVLVPVLEMRPPESYESLDAALGELSGFDWLILTSGNSVEAVAARCALQGVSLKGFDRLRVAAVGRTTAAAAVKAGLRVDVVPESFASEGVVAALRKLVGGKKVLLARAAVARDLIPEELAAAGAVMTVVDAYRTAIPEGAKERFSEALRGGVDVAAFTSSSSVKHLAALAHEAGVGFPLKGVKAVSIGPVTSETLREFGWEPAAEATRADVQSLVEALLGLRNRE